MIRMITANTTRARLHPKITMPNGPLSILPTLDGSGLDAYQIGRFHHVAVERPS
jgi:hypothetical protein